MLNRCSPVGAESDIVYPADEDFKVPDISQYDGVRRAPLLLHHSSNRVVP